MNSVSRAAVLALFLCLAGCLETMESSYATRQEAVEAGQVAKGWIPRWVPASATNLREIHNLDSNASALAFDLPVLGL